MSMEEMQKKIREILMSNWDPIGIKELPEAQSEYGMYIPDIETLLSERASSEKISQYLLWVEQARMGLTRLDNERITKTANELIKLISHDPNH